MLKKRILARLRQHRERHQRQKYGTYYTNARASYHPVGSEMLPVRPELPPITQRLTRAAKLPIYAGRSTQNMDVVDLCHQLLNDRGRPWSSFSF